MGRVLRFPALQILMIYDRRQKHYIVQLKSVRPHSSGTIYQLGKTEKFDLRPLQNAWDAHGHGRISAAEKDWLIQTLTTADHQEASLQTIQQPQTCPSIVF